MGKVLDPRPWLYQTPEQILIKASNGASDFGNKFGQPLICGSVLTFEHEENNKKYAYDKVIMLAGGVGYANMRDALRVILNRVKRWCCWVVTTIVSVWAVVLYPL